MQQTFQFSKVTNVIQCKPCNQNINSVCPVKPDWTAVSSLNGPKPEYVAHAPVADSGTKTDALLLHCSINDTLINWIPHCQNMSTNLINSLDPMFVPISNPLLQNLLRISCTHNYYYYHFGTCNNYLCEFFKIQWLHFTGVVDKVLSAHVKILQDSVCQKLLKSVQFWLSY